jgi:hypothetical protein
MSFIFSLAGYPIQFANIKCLLKKIIYVFASQEEEDIDGAGGRERGEQQTTDSNNSGAPMLFCEH